VIKIAVVFAVKDRFEVILSKTLFSVTLKCMKMYINSMPAHWGGLTGRGRFTCRGRKNSLQVDDVLMARLTTY
jgi:hypothetical protein